MIYRLVVGGILETYVLLTCDWIGVRRVRCYALSFGFSCLDWFAFWLLCLICVVFILELAVGLLCSLVLLTTVFRFRCLGVGVNGCEAVVTITLSLFGLLIGCWFAHFFLFALIMLSPECFVVYYWWLCLFVVRFPCAFVLLWCDILRWIVCVLSTCCEFGSVG